MIVGFCTERVRARQKRDDYLALFHYSWKPRPKLPWTTILLGGVSERESKIKKETISLPSTNLEYVKLVAFDIERFEM